MNNPVIFQAGGVILLLFFCFLTYLNTKSWRALHVTMMFFCFGSAIAFAVYGSMVMKTRKNWQDYFTKAEKNLDKAEKDLKVITDGNPADVPQKADNIRVLTEEVGRLMIDRGRVWRECRPTNRAPDSVTLSTTPASLPEGVTAPANRIEERLVLYAFREINSPDAPEVGRVPGVYLGAFRVTAATPDSVTMAPLHPFDAQQQRHLQDPEATWTLYETLPVDDYTPFADRSDEQIRNLFPAALVEGVQPARLEALHNRYLRTGKAADTNDTPYEVWLRVKFLKEHTVDVDSPDAPAAALDGGFFEQGRAVVARLKRGENKVAVGETTLLFREKEGEQLIADNIVELIERVYMRPLNDYGFKFTQKFTRETAINHRLIEVKRDLDTMVRATDKANKQIAYREGEKMKLEDDLTKVKYEATEIGKYLVKLEQRNATVRAEMSDLYRQNRALLAELTALNTKLADEINAKTAQVSQ